MLNKWKKKLTRKEIKLEELTNINKDIQSLSHDLNSNEMYYYKKATIGRLLTIENECESIIAHLFSKNSVEYMKINDIITKNVPTNKNGKVESYVIDNFCGELLGVVNGCIAKIKIGEDNKKYQFFISSTYHDLIKQREVVASTIVKSGNMYIGMEDFHSLPTSQLKYLENNIMDADYFILLLGRNYGSIIENGEISYTHFEFNTALKYNKPILVFFCEDKSILNQDEKYVESAEKMQQFERFCNIAKSKSNPGYFSSNDELAKVLNDSIQETIKKFPQGGWVKCD